MMSAAATLPSWLQIDLANMQYAPEISWLAPFREAQRQALLKHGMPTRKHERWKYADLSFLNRERFTLAQSRHHESLQEKIHRYRLRDQESVLIVIIDGCFAPHLSALTQLPKGAVVCHI